MQNKLIEDQDDEMSDQQPDSEKIFDDYQQLLNENKDSKQLEEQFETLEQRKQQIQQMRQMLDNMENARQKEQNLLSIQIQYRKQQEIVRDSYTIKKNFKNLKKVISQFSYGETDNKAYLRNDTSQENQKIIQEQKQLTSELQNFIVNYERQIQQQDKNDSQVIDQEGGEIVRSGEDQDSSNDDSEDIADDYDKDKQQKGSNTENDKEQNLKKQTQDLENQYQISVNFLEKETMRAPSEQPPQRTPEHPIAAQNEYQIKFMIEIRSNVIIATSRRQIFLIRINPQKNPIIQVPETIQNGNSITSLTKYQDNNYYKFIIALKNGKIEIWDSKNDQLVFIEQVLLSDERGRFLIQLSNNILVTIGGERKVKLFHPEIQPRFGIRSNVLLIKPPQCLYANLYDDNFRFIAVAGKASLNVWLNYERIIHFGQFFQNDQVKFMGLQNNRIFVVVFKQRIVVVDYTEQDQTYHHQNQRQIQFHNNINHHCQVFGNLLVVCVRKQGNHYDNYQIANHEDQYDIQLIQNLNDRMIKLVKYDDFFRQLFYFIVVNLNVTTQRLFQE